MNRKLAFIALAIPMVMGFVACDKKDEQAAIVSGRDSVTGANINLGAEGIASANGLVMATSSQGQFEAAIEDLFSASPDGVNGIPSNSIGSVSSSGDPSQGGFFFGGRVVGGAIHLINGQANTTSFQIQPSSALFLQVQDRINGALQEPLLRLLKAQSSGSVNGNTAQLRFSDGITTIIMNGTFANNYFTGNSLSFQNSRTVGGGGNSGTIGKFIVPACQFFVCQ